MRFGDKEAFGFESMQMMLKNLHFLIYSSSFQNDGVREGKENISGENEKI